MSTTTCPTWCTATTEEHAHDGPDLVLHRRGVGPFSVFSEEGGKFYANIEVDGQTSADLRRLAATAIQLAQWIERESGTAPSGPTFVVPGELHHISTALPMLGVDEYAAHGLVESGKLKASKIEGRTYVTGKAVAEYLAAQQ